MNKDEKVKILKEEIELKQQEVIKLEQELKEENKEIDEYIKNLDCNALEELRQTKEILNSKGGDVYLNGRHNRFINLFDNKISKEKFIELIIRLDNK